MMQYADPLLWHLVDTVVGGVDLTLMTPPFGRRGLVWKLEEISVCNRDAGGGLVDVGVFDGGREVVFETITLGSAGTVSNAHLRMTLLTDYQVFARFRYDAVGQPPTCSDGNVCAVAINGCMLAPFTSP